mmetsp:Transcript_100654/g.323163  ORF Transcript_100654/g.323163 Transcript_100654/m.323163 type:complete len:313 (-) Transcript_100654:315-1253(-)
MCVGLTVLNYESMTQLRRPATEPAALLSTFWRHPSSRGQVARLQEDDEASSGGDIILLAGTRMKKGEHEVEQFRLHHSSGFRAGRERLFSNDEAGVEVWFRAAAFHQKNVHQSSPDPVQGCTPAVRPINGKAGFTAPSMYFPPDGAHRAHRKKVEQTMEWLDDRLSPCPSKSTPLTYPDLIVGMGGSRRETLATSAGLTPGKQTERITGRFFREVLAKHGLQAAVIGILDLQPRGLGPRCQGSLQAPFRQAARVHPLDRHVLRPSSGRGGRAIQERLVDRPVGGTDQGKPKSSGQPRAEVAAMTEHGIIKDV